MGAVQERVVAVDLVIGFLRDPGDSRTGVR